MIKKSGFCGGPGFFPPNRANLKNFKKLRFGWKKAGPLKKPFLF